MKTHSKELLFSICLLLPLLILIVFFELVPLASMIIKSFLAEETHRVGLSNYIEIFSNKFFTLSIFNSLWLSFVSSGVGMVVALLAANSLHHTTGKLKDAFLKVLNMTSNFAGIPLAFAFMILLGNTGFFVLLGKFFHIRPLAEFNLYSVAGMLLSYIYFQIPLATLFMYPAFNAIKQEYREAAKILNTDTLSFWLYIGLPILLPGILGTFSVLFANAVAAYATAYALMGSNFTLLPIRISAMFVGDIVQRQEMGSALSLVLMGLMGIVVLLNNLAVRKLRGNVHD